MQENNCHFVCSRGILKSCDVKSLTPSSSVCQMVNYNVADLHDGCTLYVCTMAVPHLYHLMKIGAIKVKFILVSGDCDVECSPDLLSNVAEFNEFIENPQLIHWHSQNCIVKHPKISQIPIGLDYHTISDNPNHFWGKQCTPYEQEQLLFFMRTKSLSLENRVKKCYSNFHFSVNDGRRAKYDSDRISALNDISSVLIHFEPHITSREETWKNQSKFAFVVSPHGNGLDCHRTWEALCLGCIVIVKSSPLDDLFSDLPVLIVDEWKHVTRELLDKTVADFTKKQFKMEKLLLNYWVDKIRHTK